ncbi:DUF4351 domain-containing protein [Crocosphaera sp.]|uniref:DUF4351 domain-containing protein n=1 Tax=Crocosphaera sp. TaxID=2729996 RepID=UPI003422B969
MFYKLFRQLIIIHYPFFRGRRNVRNTIQETRVYREIEQERKEVEARSLIFRQLTKRVGELSPEVHQSVENLSLEQLENLGEALLDFNNMADLENWLKGDNGEN